MKVVYEPAAYEEVLEASSWYLAEAGERYAEALIREIDAKLALLMRQPKIGTPSGNQMRRMPLKVFPYTLHYKIESELIRIFAFAHQKRRPGYWLKR